MLDHLLLEASLRLLLVYRRLHGVYLLDAPSQVALLGLEPSISIFQLLLELLVPLFVVPDCRFQVLKLLSAVIGLCLHPVYQSLELFDQQPLLL